MGGDVLVRVVIPGVVVFCMAVVGLDLTFEDGAGCARSTASRRSKDGGPPALRAL